MATVTVSTSQNLTAVSFADGDTIDVANGVTLTINSSFTATKPAIIQALGTGRIEVSNTSTTTPILLDFRVNANASGFNVQQNGVLQIRGNWITVKTAAGTSTETLFTASSVGGVDYDYPTLVKVETAAGSGVYEIWPVIPEQVSGGEVNAFGINGSDLTAGTVAVNTGGTVTGTGTSFNTAYIGARFKVPSIARDFVINSISSTTSLTVQELDGSAYAGGAVTAGSAYNIRSGSAISRNLVGNQSIGKVLFFNPLTKVVSTGDGTNGTLVPAGAKIIIPNIVLSSVLQSTTLAAAITSTAAQTITLAAAIGGSSISAFSTAARRPSLLLVNGSTVERVHYTTRSGTTVSATGQVRGVYGTIAQASFPIGTTVYYLPSSAETAFAAGFNCSPSGTIDVEIACATTRFYNICTNYAYLRQVNFGSMTFTTAGGAGGFLLDTCQFTGSGFFTFGAAVISCAAFGSMIGAGSINNIYGASNQGFATATTQGYSFSNLPSLSSVSNIRFYGFKRAVNQSSSVYRGITFSNINCSTPVSNLYTSNGSLICSVQSSQDFKDLYVSASGNSESNGTADGMTNYFLSNTSNVIFRGLQLWPGGVLSRAGLFNIDTGSQNNVIHNKGYGALDGGAQCSSIVSDTGLNTIVSHITVTNSRVTNTNSHLSGDVTINSKGVHRMLLIDSINSNATSTGSRYKGGLECDVVAGPYRLWSNNSTAAVVPNLTDVQPIVVLSNVAKTVGSLFVGGFSAQSLLNMYDLSSIGSGYFDNLGRIYLPGNGDSVIIKSPYSNKGISSFNTAGTLDYNFDLSGVLNNPIPADITVQFRMSNWGTANTGSWITLTSLTDLETARAALSGYSSSIGFDIQFKITSTAASSKYIMNMRFSANIDSAYNPAVSNTSIGITNSVSGMVLAGYDNTTPATPVLRQSVTLSSTSGSVLMPYDYDGNVVAYRLVARKQGYQFFNATGSYSNSNISIPVTQLQILDTAGNPLYVSGVTGVSFNHTTQKITVSSNMTEQQLWSACQDELCLLANFTKTEFFSTSNGTSYNCLYDLEINNCTLSGTGTILMPTKTLSFVGTGVSTVPVVDISGTNVLINISNIVPNSRVQIYNTTNSIELYNAIVTGTSLQFKTIWTADKSIRVRATYCVGTSAYVPYQVSGTLLNTGVSFSLAQQVDTIYNSIGINGSTVTECSADFPNVQIDLNDVDGATTVQRIYAWFHYIEYSAGGIQNFFGGLEADDSNNFRIYTSIVNLKLDNRNASPLLVTGAYLYRDDGTSVIASTSNSIQMDPQKSYVANSDSINAKLDKTLTTSKFLALK